MNRTQTTRTNTAALCFFAIWLAAVVLFLNSPAKAAAPQAVGPPPDVRLALATKSNTGDVAIRYDGAGAAFIAYRDVLNTDSPGAVLYRVKDGVTTQLIGGQGPAAYGTVEFDYTPDGYADLTTVDKEGRTLASWHIDDRPAFGFVARSYNARAAFIPELHR